MKIHNSKLNKYRLLILLGVAFDFCLAGCAWIPKQDPNSERTYIPALSYDPPSRKAKFLNSDTFVEKIEIRKNGIAIIVDGEYVYQPKNTGLLVNIKFLKGEPPWTSLGLDNFKILTGCKDAEPTFHKNEKTTGEYHLFIPLQYHMRTKMPGERVKGQVPQSEDWEYRRELENLKCRTVMLEINNLFDQPYTIEIRENPDREEKLEQELE